MSSLTPERIAEIQSAVEDIDDPVDGTWGLMAIRALLAERETLEADLRREWWGNHGHDFYALYGDDGEMQCSLCPADFKRQPLNELRTLVFSTRLARAALMEGAPDA